MDVGVVADGRLPGHPHHRDRAVYGIGVHPTETEHGILDRDGPGSGCAVHDSRAVVVAQEQTQVCGGAEAWVGGRARGTTAPPHQDRRRETPTAVGVVEMASAERSRRSHGAVSDL